MSEEARGVNTNEETGAPGREEFNSATEVMLAMVKAAKALRIYLPNNPVLIKFIEELDAGMAAHLRRYGEFRLDVEPFVLRYKGKDVYDNRDPKDSIAFRIHSDGIRILFFQPGLEQRELKVFIGIVAFDQPAAQDDDIVTQLWERDLPHIKYVLEDDLIEMALDEEETEKPSQQEAISRIFAAVAAAPPLPLRMVPKHLLMLTRDDAGWLRKARQSEVNRNPLEDVFHILFSILAGTRDPRAFKDFVEIAAHLTESLFMVAEIGHVLMLVRFLDDLRNRESLGPEQRQLIGAAIDGILCDKTVQALQEAIDAGDAVGYDEVRELLLLLGLPSLGAICELLGRVEKLKMRKVIVEVLVELGKESPKVFEPFLSDPRWYLVRNLVLVLSLLGTPLALEMIVRLISHREQRIRREVLGFLERSPDPKAKSYIVKYLRDESGPLRVRALQVLARERLPYALKPIIALTAADDFKNKELAEKKAVYEAIGEMGGEREIPLFREMLLKKRWFQKSAQKETVICAVAGLMKMRTPEALALLEEASSNRNPEARQIIVEALAEINAGQHESAADAGEE